MPAFHILPLTTNMIQGNIQSFNKTEANMFVPNTILQVSIKT